MWGRDKSHRYGYGALDADGSPDYGFSDYMADEYDSMMGMVAASVPFWKFTLTGQFYAGQNLGGVRAGCAQTVTYRKAPYLGGFVRGNEVRSIGGFADLGFKLNSKWSFAIGYGCDDPVDGDVEDTINGFCLFNDRAYVNATYKVTDNLGVALEYARDDALCAGHVRGRLVRRAAQRRLRCRPHPVQRLLRFLSRAKG